jgi:predicted O-linked N-acetylglucosamine transferase (SPINDLY family)
MQEEIGLGLAAHRAGQRDVAERHYRAALAANPDHPDAVRLIGLLMAERGDPEAEAWLGRAVQLAPAVPSAHFNLALLLTQTGRMAEALAHADKALALKPDHHGAWMVRARALAALNRPAEALDAYDRVLAHHFDLAALIGRGVMLSKLRRLDEAVVTLQQAAAHAPRDAPLAMGLADMLSMAGRREEAAVQYDRAYALNPALPRLKGNRLSAKSALCDWRDWDKECEEVLAAVETGELAASSLVKLDSTLAQQQACARLFAARVYPDVPPLWRGENYGHARLRVAYVSAVLRQHATGMLAVDLFERHDRKDFEWFAIDTGPDDGSVMRRRLEKAFDHFLPLAAEDDAAIARRIREREIDIAIDLDGGIVDARPGIFAHRPAPLSVGFLGYPGTMGTRHIDALIADRITVPESDFAFFDEKIAWMPDCYQPNSVRPPLPAAPSRAEAGLPDQGFVFCCFNDVHKITPSMFAIWMRLLAQAPGSVLWLLARNLGARANLRREAEARGIDPARLVFAEAADLPLHLARHALADLFLDTLPYNAHTTASDALWCGLPVLTVRGRTFAGRVAASLLHAIGLEDLAAPDLAAYEGLALALAADPERLAALRGRLARNRDTHPLFDIARFTGNLENLYRDLWRQKLTARRAEG